MDIKEVLSEVLKEHCPAIHNTRLNALLDVAEWLRNSQNLSLSAIGRNLYGEAKVKHKIKKVDRCLGNEKLHEEIEDLYKGLSYYIFEYINSQKEVSIAIDVCCLIDDRRLQMLSAQLCTKGRTLPLYQEVFREGELKGRVEGFLAKLNKMIPSNKKVILIMDAGFHVEWFKIAEKYKWDWICRIRQGKDLQVNNSGKWVSVKDFIQTIKEKTTDYNNCLLTREHEHYCRIVTTRKDPKGRKQKISRDRVSSKIACGRYSAAAKEPWILATNLSQEEYKGADIVALYGKRMQIEETFRDIKSHQFGLAGRNIRTSDVYRWATLMLLASIVIICYWVIGVIGHSQGMQKIFQSNTVNNRKVFSYFTLGKFIIEFDRLKDIGRIDKSITSIIHDEINRP